MDRYTELYAWIWQAFGQEEFSIDEFRATFPSPQPAKVLHDLTKEGYVQRKRRGTYQAVSPNQLIQGVVARDFEAMEAVRMAKKPYAFSHSTAVMIWTSGYYWTGFTKGFRPLHIKVLKEDLSYWHRFFSERKVKYAHEDEKRTLFGFAYILHPVQEVRAVEREGYQVVPLEEVIEYCLEHEAIYQPALEYLDEHFDIGYKETSSKP